MHRRILSINNFGYEGHNPWHTQYMKTVCLFVMWHFGCPRPSLLCHLMTLSRDPLPKCHVLIWIAIYYVYLTVRLVWRELLIVKLVDISLRRVCWLKANWKVIQNYFIISGRSNNTLHFLWIFRIPQMTFHYFNNCFFIANTV